MLRSCTKNEFDKYTDFIYELAMDLTKSGYPTYCDGIKTKVKFVERSLKAFRRDTEHMLLFECEGEVQGMIHYFWIPEDHYLQTIGFNISKAIEQAISEFLAYVGERFKGYDVLLRFPTENHSAVNFLAGQGFECIENDYNNTAFLDKLDKTRGAVYYRATALVDGWFEIYGIDMNQEAYNPELFKELLNAALLDAKRRKGRFMTFFCDEEYEKATIECGFKCVGYNLCYKTHLE